MVEHLRRHGCSPVKVSGTPEFRSAMTGALLNAGISVAGEVPPVLAPWKSGQDGGAGQVS